MTGSIGDIYNNYYTQNNASSVKASALESKLNSDALKEATDEELMDACKEFEAYLIEQVMKQVQESIPKSEEEEDNKYLDYFGDMMLQEYSGVIAENGDLGIAQMLYESMKKQSEAITPAQLREMKQAQTDMKTTPDDIETTADTEATAAAISESAGQV